jgi:hypothetical protein
LVVDLWLLRIHLALFYPEYATRAELYKFVDDELTAITPLLKEPKSNEAYRVDQAAAWMLQANCI